MEISHSRAKQICKKFKIKLPKVGYMVSTNKGCWLSSTGHPRFGWFESTAKTPFVITCICGECILSSVY